MATIIDVAKKAGVSVTTVSRALNGTAPVNQQTKERIMKVIEELDFVPSMMAQGMRTKKSKTLGVIIPDYINPFYNELFKYLEEAAKREGYHVIITSTGEDSTEEIGYVNDLVHRNIDGIIVCSYRGERETIEQLLNISKKLPIIFMDHLKVDKPVNAVYTDGYEGIKKVTEHIISLGHREIAFIKPLSKYKVANDRYEGYVDAMKEAGLTLRDNLVYEGNYHMQSGFSAARHFFENGSTKPTAIVAATDFMAMGAINYLRSCGIKIPEDVVVAGYDDIYIGRMVTPPLTTYRQPIQKLAEETIKLFMNKLKHVNAKNRHIVLEGELVIRRSTDIRKKEIELFAE